MNQKITNFHLDSESHWVANLECGHAQHVRHDPPFFTREWVLSNDERQKRIGTTLNCVRCDEMGLKIAKAVLESCETTLRTAYEQAGISGLCADGRWEAAVGALTSVSATDLTNLVHQALDNE